MPTLLPDDEWDHWGYTEDDGPDPIGATITIEAAEEGGEGGGHSVAS